MKVIQLTDENECLVRFSVGDRLRWQGRLFEIVDVADLVPAYQQVVLRDLEREALPISVPATDLLGVTRM